jgi:hypothetical protein
VADQYQIRMVRVDGQGLQTLVCSVPGGVIYSAQWSFDQKLVVFDMNNTGIGGPTTYLMDITKGSLQAEVLPDKALGFLPRTWLDNSHVYMIGIVPNADAPPQNIYLLDLQKGPNQHSSDLLKVVTVSQRCVDFDSSYDSTQLLMSTCAIAGGGLGSPSGPSTITIQPATGGTQQNVYTNATLAVTTVRVVTKTTLLLLIENYNGDSSQNGLWKLNTDGTGFTRLSIDTHTSQSLCPYSQYSWSNVSPDGSMYALQSYVAQTNTYSMYYGSMGGGTPNQFADISDGTQLYLVGWTDI